MVLKFDSFGGTGEGKVQEWKKLNSKELGIKTTMISRTTRKVLNNLKQKGMVLCVLLMVAIGLAFVAFHCHIMRIL